MSKKPSKHFGKFLQALREERGMTQEQLAAGVGLSSSAISRQEQMEVCRLRNYNTEAVANYLNYHSRLSADDVIYLKVHGKLRADWEAQDSNSNAPAFLEIALFEKHFPGDMRVKSREVFDSLMMEMGAKSLLIELLSIAAKRNIKLDVRDDVT